MGNYKTIITFTLPHEAYLAKGFLESEGIDAIIKDEFTAQVNNFYSNAIGGVKLQVKESEFEEGLVILKKGGYINSENTEEVHIEIVPLDDTTNINRCPFCQSENIGKQKKPSILTVIVCFMSGVIFPIFKKSYNCFDCGKKWRFSKK